MRGGTFPSPLSLGAGCLSVPSPSLPASRARSACVVWGWTAHAAAGWQRRWSWHPSCPVSSQLRPAFLQPVLPFSLPASFLPVALSKALLLLVRLGVPGAGRGRRVLNGIWREFWREQGGGIVKQSEQIAYPS